MKKITQKKILETRLLTKSIFEGQSIFKMSKILNCSKSAVSYKMSKLFERYNVSTRIDFIIVVLGIVLDKTKQKLNIEIQKTYKLNELLDSQSIILGNLIINKNDKNKMDFWLKKAEEFIHNLTY